MDSSDQIQIRIFEIHNLSGFFLEKVFEKSIFVKELFEKKNGKQQMPYICDILTEPMLMAPY